MNGYNAETKTTKSNPDETTEAETTNPTESPKKYRYF